jgi:hypothetical protein
MTNQPPRIQVKETTSIDIYSFEGKLEDIISRLQSELDNGWEGIDIDYDYEDGNSYRLYKHRPETNKEYEKRMKLLEIQKTEKLQAKERRRKEFEKLKLEFGND